MPPIGEFHSGREAYARLANRGLGGSMGRWRLIPTSANRQPALANYLRRPDNRAFKAFKVDVFRIEDGAIIQIVSFGTGLFAEFDLPTTLETTDRAEEME